MQSASDLISSGTSLSEDLSLTDLEFCDRFCDSFYDKSYDNSMDLDFNSAFDFELSKYMNTAPPTFFNQDGSLNRQVLGEYMLLPQAEIAIVPNFLVAFNLGVNHTELWNSIQSLEYYKPSDGLIYDSPAKILPGNHPSLKYCDMPVRRSMFTVQTDFDKGIRRYGFRGWQLFMSFAQSRIEYIPPLKTVTENINARMNQADHFNHVTGLIYKDGEERCGLQSQRLYDIKPGTGFIDLKLGHPRKMQISDRNRQVFFNYVLPAGTAVICSARDTCKFGTPPQLKLTEPSASLVWRCISTTIKWESSSSYSVVQ